MVVVWSKSAKESLKQAFKYIALDSLSNAQMVKNTIIDSTIELSKNPEKHPLDKFKTENDGTWRAFEKHHYRISYRVLQNELRVVRMRHTSRSPLTY